MSATATKTSVNGSEDPRMSKFRETLEKTKAEVGEVGKKLKEYDEKYHATQTVREKGEKAQQFLSTALEETQEALNDLSTQTKSLFDSAAEVPIKAISKSIAVASGKLEELRSLAKQYDAKYQVSETVFDTVNPARERAMKYLADLASDLTEILHATLAQLKGVSDGIKQRVLGVRSTGMNYLINTAAALDTKYNVEGKLKEIDEKYKVTETITEQAKKLDEKLKLRDRGGEILEKAKNLDEKFTEGKTMGYIEEAYNSGMKMVTEGLEKLQKDFDTAKRSSRDNLTALNGTPSPEKPRK